jgi:SAM-dependent methyltransferase
MLKKAVVAVLNQIPNSEYAVAWLRGPERLEKMNRWQEAFCEWNAQRLNISVEESRQRYKQSWESMRGGHRGVFFRWFLTLSNKVYAVFFNDQPSEVFEAYQFSAPLYFLRYLSYKETKWADDHALVRGLSGKKNPVIADFGCGLAQHSIALAEKLRDMGASPRLVLIDIPTMRKDFLAFLCAKLNLPADLLDSTRAKPLPELPAFDALIATEVFEHLHDPVAYFDAFDARLAPGGFILTQIKDHRPELFHVSPGLQALRDRFAAKGYEAVIPFVLYKKPL